MYIDIFGKPIEKDALVINRRCGGKYSISIWWRYVPSQALRITEMNGLLEGLDDTLEYKEPAKGCKTIATTAGIINRYFVWGEGNQVCGAREVGDDIELFRYFMSKGDGDGDEMGAGLAYNVFREKTKEITGKTLNVIFGGLPEEFHQYRECVPSPINWTNTLFTNKIKSGCVKADICSAYGTEASKTLPDLHAKTRKLIDGRVEPNADYPFAFYLKSGEMAIWGEGNSWDYSKRDYLGNKPRKFVAEEEEMTLLCRAATTSLRPVFEYFYDNRKTNEEYKFVMVASIGMFHRRKFTSEADNLWPIAAVIKFRCNKRIIDYCDALVEMGQLPMLINTDSITWRGSDTSLTTTEKKLGNFALEHANCSILYSGAKKYQVRDDDTNEVITRWSGNHRRCSTTDLAFGEILNKEVSKKLEEEEQRATYKWNKEIRRFVNKLGEIIQEEIEYDD